MRKFSVLFVLVISSVFFARAQSTTASAHASNPGGFIIKGGVSFSNISTQKDGSYSDANTLTTFNAGVLADVPLADILSLQPGIVLTGKGSKASASSLGVGVTNTFNPLYIEVPVNVVVKLPLGGDSRVFLGAGPYGAIGIGGKSKYTIGSENFENYSDHNIKFGDSNSDDLKSFDFGLNGLAGIEVSRLILGVNYGLGLSKISPNQNDNNANDRNKYRVFSINAGIRF